MKEIHKRYPLLTPDERFRLFVQAMGRKDEQELDRLENTCPRRHYAMQDYAYTDRKMQFMVLALTTRLCALRNDLVCLLALVAALAADGGVDEPAELSEKALEVFAKLMRIRKGKRDGWLRFCEEIGVDADAMTKSLIDGTEWVMQPAEAAWEILGVDAVNDPSEAEEIAKREFQTLVGAWGET